MLDEQKIQTLKDFVSHWMELKKVPGVSLGFLNKSEKTVLGMGVTNVDHPLEVIPETLFQIGSITKTMTGMAAMCLVETGKLALSARVQTYLPEFRVKDEIASSGVTVFNLLTHTNGWVGDFHIETGSGDDALARYVVEMANLEQLAPLGEVWTYSNSGFALLGRVMEPVTGETYEHLMQRLILDPLGMDRSTFYAGDVMTARFAVGHNVEDEHAVVAHPWPLPRAINPAGGVICDIHDLMKYADMVLNRGVAVDGKTVVQPETLEEMLQPQIKVSNGFHTGLSWGIIDQYGMKTIFHTGGTVGQSSLLFIIPEIDFAFGMLTNSSAGGTITWGIGDWVLQNIVGLVKPQQTKHSPVSDDSPPNIDQYIGVYQRPFARVEIGKIGERLVGIITNLQGFPSQDIPPEVSPPPMTLEALSEDSLMVCDGPQKGSTWEVLRTHEGKVHWLRIGARIHPKVS
jgi:CubicO group peptidase (beta-lactamase class C family)